MTTNETPLARCAAELLLRAAVLAFGQPREESLSLLAQQLRAICEMLPLSSTGAPDLSIIIPPTLPQTCAAILQNVSSCHLGIIFDTLWVLYYCMDNDNLVESIVENNCHVQLIRLLSHPELQVAESAVSLLEILSRTRRAAPRRQSRVLWLMWLGFSKFYSLVLCTFTMLSMMRQRLRRRVHCNGKGR